MIEVKQPIEQQLETLTRVFAHLKELHALSVEGRSDRERIQDGMKDLILGETTREATQALIAKEIDKLLEQADQEHWSFEVFAQKIMHKRQEITAKIFAEHWYESTLSTPEHPIHAATYGTSMFRFDLRMSIAESPSQENLQKFGVIMFDVDGLRSFKDCTSHSETTRFLQGIVRILTNAQGPTRKRLGELGIDVIPMATGGDEFVLYLHGKNQLTPELIQETVSSFQLEISSSEELQTMLDFDSEKALIHYGLPSSAQRKEYAKMERRQQLEILRKIRATLPPKFIPHIAGGGALLTEGIALAVEKDERDLKGADETFISLREKIVQWTIELAESRQKANKEKDKHSRKLVDDRQFQFETRGSEARKLQETIDTLEKAITATRARCETLLSTEPEARILQEQLVILAKKYELMRTQYESLTKEEAEEIRHLSEGISVLETVVESLRSQYVRFLKIDEGEAQAMKKNIDTLEVQIESMRIRINVRAAYATALANAS